MRMEKNIDKDLWGLLEIVALIVALSAIVVFVFYLLLAWDKCIIFTEPIAYIRWSEIVMGVVAGAVLGVILKSKVVSFYRGDDG